MIMQDRISMAQVLKDTTIRIRITGKLRAAVRMWLGVRLLKVAAAVIGCQIQIAVGEDAGLGA